MTIEESREMLGNIGTVLLIQNDCESIKQLVLNFQDSIFCMRIIPYMALFCRSFQEYAEIESQCDNQRWSGYAQHYR